MLTPQEIQERAVFEKAVFGGYNMKEVDDLVVPLTEDYSALYKENAVLKSQLKVVVDKLEEYHRQEDSLNRAMIAAQKTADEMVAETERKCARMLSDTEQLLRKRKEELQAELEEENQRVAEVKKTSEQFMEDLEQQMLSCLSQIRRIRGMSSEEETQPQPAAAAVQPVAETEAAPASELPQEEAPEEIVESRMFRSFTEDAAPGDTRALPIVQPAADPVELVRADTVRTEMEKLNHEIDQSIQRILEDAEMQRAKAQEQA